METTETELIPYPWQQKDIDRLAKNMTQEAGALVTSSPGAGKTLVAIEIAKKLGAKVILIIAPQGTHESAWGRTARRQGLTENVQVLLGTSSGKRAWADLMWGKPGVYLCTWQWFCRQKWKSIHPDMVIADEIHNGGTYGTASQKKLHELIHAKYRLGLSGTPIRNKFENAWSICTWIEPAKVPLGYWMWRIMDCATEYDRFAPQNRKVVGEKVPGKLFNSLTNYVQHRQREKCCEFHPNGFLAELPEPLKLVRNVPMTPEQKKFYREIENNLAADLVDDTGQERRIHTDMLLVARGILRFCALAMPSIDPETEKLTLAEGTDSPKLDALIEDLPSFEGGRALVLTHSKQFTKVAVDKLASAGYTVEGWSGDASKRKRDEILKRFRGGDLEIIVGVISAMGTGTDGLQEATHNLVWMSYDDDPSNNLQGLGRLDRLGQKEQVVIREYNSEDTIDQGIFHKQMQRVMALEQSLRKERTG